ncbi:MAG: RNA polymerase sigma-54 factor, partial [Candidatus Omnitrophica bacterium]|nr:RNA polymerase sigma-54 factor [Candidatus Omnitrophota bacterium]
NALLFIKSIEQRGSTILAIGEYILDKQKNFLKIGPSNLTPMTLKDVAKHLNRNESTISRAIQNKFVLTPLGLLPIKYFFTQAIQGNNEIFSNQSLKEEIRDLIDDEDKAHPLSDQGIVDYFAQKGINIARRTINKYRKALKILPSYLRKN